VRRYRLAQGAFLDGRKCDRLCANQSQDASRDSTSQVVIRANLAEAKGVSVYNLLRLPSCATLLVNNVGLIRPPFLDGQILISVRLDNGTLIEATWNEHRYECSIVAYEADGKVALRVSTARPAWLPGIVNTVVWNQAFKSEAAKHLA
jgi:hypothetical protein